MAKRVRDINDDMCGRFEEDLNNVRFEFDRFMGRQREFERTEWLGGDQKANAFEAPPARCAKAMALLRQAQELMRQADHEVAMFRAIGDEPHWMDKDKSDDR